MDALLDRCAGIDNHVNKISPLSSQRWLITLSNGLQVQVPETNPLHREKRRILLENASTLNGPLIVDDVETLIRAAIDGVGLAFVQTSVWHRNSQVGNSSACWMIGVNRSLDSSSITRAGGSSLLRSRP